MNQYTLKDARFVLSAPQVDILPEETLAETAFVGRSNVGKSSLLNFITARKGLAKVSRTPGRTRALNLFSATLMQKTSEGQKTERPFLFVDLPGVGYAKLSHTEKDALSELLADYLEQRSTLKAVFHLLDARRDPNEEDLALSRLLRSSSLAYIAVITKVDQVPLSKRIPLQKKLAQVLAIAPDQCVLTSTDAQIGREALLAKLWELVA